MKKARKKKKDRSKDEESREDDERTRKMDVLRREVSMGAENSARQRKLLREMMTRIKMPNIRKNMLIARITFERALDVKDYSISLLLDELDELEVQRRRSQGSHAQVIDKILSNYRSKIRSSEDRYKRDLCGELADDRKERQEIDGQQQEDQGFLRAVILAMQEKFNELLSNAQAGMMSKIDNWAEEHLNLREVAATELENRFQSMQADLKQVLAKYENGSRRKRVVYEELKEKHERNKRTMKRQLARTASLFEKIQKTREKIRDCEHRTEKEIADLRSELDFFVEAHRAIKNRFLSEEATDKAQLSMMTLESNRTAKRLASIATKGRHLFTLIQNCRKFYTEDEKIPTFPATAGEEEPTVNSRRSFVSLDWEKKISEDLECLENFWRRLGAAQMIKDELATEKERLKLEKSDLQERLRQYMSQQSPTSKNVSDLPSTGQSSVITNPGRLFQEAT